MHVHHRHGNRVAADGAPRGEIDDAVDQRHVGGGAAHIEAQQARDPVPPAHVAGAHQATGRPRQQQVDRAPRRPVGADGHAGTLHDVHRRWRHALLQAFQVALDARTQPGVEPGRHAALVFADFRQHFRGTTDEQIVGQRVANHPLEAVVQPGEQQVDGHRLRLQRGDTLRQFAARVGVQRFHHGTVGADPAARLQAQFGRHRRSTGRGLQIVERLAGLATDGKHIPETVIGDIDGAHPLAFQRRIGGHRGTMNQAKPAPLQPQLADALQDCALRGIGRGQHLVEAQPPPVEAHEIGKGSTRVDTQQHGFLRMLPPRNCGRRAWPRTWRRRRVAAGYAGRRPRRVRQGPG